MGPTWLASALALGMAAVLVVGVGHLVGSVRARDAGALEGALLHVVMGAAMLLMLVGGHGHGADDAWQLVVFGAAGAWFVWRTLQDLARQHPVAAVLRGPVQHLTGATAMLWMLVLGGAPAGPGPGQVAAAPSSHAHPVMPATVGPGPGSVDGEAGSAFVQGTALVLVVLLLAYAVWEVAAAWRGPGTEGPGRWSSPARPGPVSMVGQRGRVTAWSAGTMAAVMGLALLIMV